MSSSCQINVEYTEKSAALSFRILALLGIPPGLSRFRPELQIQAWNVVCHFKFASDSENSGRVPIGLPGHITQPTQCHGGGSNLPYRISSTPSLINVRPQYECQHEPPGCLKKSPLPQVQLPLHQQIYKKLFAFLGFSGCRLDL